jgi:SAM-dependent methyltransferase
MLEYVAVGLCLKGFSANTISRRLYRRLGNSVGGNRRATEAMPAYYPERIRRMLRLVKQHKIVRDRDRILELGTGWLHWEALTLRLFFDIESVLFDVWDNRQLGGLKNYVGQLRSSLNNGCDLSKAQLSRANSLIDAILDAPSFAELYELLGFTYVVEETGDLSQFPDEYFDLVVSAGVLEHVTSEAVPPLITETYRLLKPGGWASHSIDTSDHLAHYDTGVSKKMYLTFSERT